MITKLSTILSIKLSQATDRQEVQDEMRYALEILIGGLLNSVILISLAIVFHLMHTFVWTVITFVSLRIVMGGYHFTTYWRCLLITIISILGSAYWASKLHVSAPTILTLILITFVIAIIVIVQRAPANEMYREEQTKRKKQLKLIALILILIWFLVILPSLLLGTQIPGILASLFGVWIQLIIMSSRAMRFLSWIEKKG